MRIEDKLGAAQLGKKTKKPGDGKVVGTSPFASELQVREKETSDYRDELNDLKGQLDKAGEELEKRPTLENLARFREIIANLTKRVSQEAYRLEKIGGTPMNPSCFEIISLIDSGLNDLYRMVLSEQKDRIALTNRIIGIRGLVVDLLG